MRIILYTGKGGVGKTSVAAATALRCAQLGYKTVIFSTDAAHSLADSFDMPLGPEPVQVAQRLWAQEMEMGHVLDLHWGTIHDWVSALMAWRGVDQIVADEMSILPGMEELASLLHIVHYHDLGEYQVILVDCAPTGETLRLLSFPEVMRWWMTRLFPVERQVANILRPIVKPLLDLPIPEDTVFESIQNLFGRLDRMRSLLTDPTLSTVRLVVNAEKMVIKEAQRTFTYLNLYGYATDAVICNRVLPPEVVDQYFEAWHTHQEKYLRVIEEGFAPLPLLRVPLFDQEVVGLPMLGRMAQALYGEADPTQVYYQGQAQAIRKEDTSYVLTLPLPFVERGQISLLQSGDELIVRVGNQRRNIVLPRALLSLSTTEARFEGNQLHIRFEQSRHTQPSQAESTTRSRRSGKGG